MKHCEFGRIGALGLTFLGAWVILKCFLPFFWPFVLGWGLAALVQPQISFLESRLRLPRGAASGIAMTVAVVLLAMTAFLIAAVGCREAGILAKGLPGALETFAERAARLEQWALARAAAGPAALSAPLTQMIRRVFNSGSALLERIAAAALPVAGSIVGSLSGGALMLGTAVVAGFLISAQYPQLHRRVMESRLWTQRLSPVLSRMGRALGSWAKAQLRLSSVTFGIVWTGFLLLRVERSLLWAILTAAVDAVPLLGTGTTLIPMAVISLIWGDRVRGIGLLGIYVTAMVTRSALEPRLVGKQLGLNPLVTLMSMYAGLRLWGVLGMILSPVLAVLALQFAAGTEET